MNEIEAIARKKGLEISIVYRGDIDTYYARAKTEKIMIVTKEFENRAGAILALNKELRRWRDA